MNLSKESDLCLLHNLSSSCTQGCLSLGHRTQGHLCANLPDNSGLHPHRLYPERTRNLFFQLDLRGSGEGLLWTLSPVHTLAPITLCVGQLKQRIRLRVAWPVTGPAWCSLHEIPSCHARGSVHQPQTGVSMWGPRKD